MDNQLSDNNLINKAYLFALDKHKGQKYGDKDFIYHPLQVYEITTLLQPADINLRVAAILHDTLEDTQTTPEEIQKEFNRDVAGLVVEVTKTAYNTFPSLKTRRGIILKFADRMSNLINITDWSGERQEKYLKKSKFWES